MRWFLAGLIFLLTSQVASNVASGQITGEVESIGFNNSYRPDCATPMIVRIKAPAGYRIANHFHPADEHVTLLDGDVTLQMNDGAQTQALTRGAYVLLPAQMHHGVSTKGGMTVQVSAMGPFQLTYVNPKDDPRTRAP